MHWIGWTSRSALKADPAKTSQLAESISNWPKSSRAYFKAIQDRVKGLAESKQLSLFSSGYWGHPAYHLPPEANLLAVAHYIEALEFQQRVYPHPCCAGRQEPALADLSRGRDGMCNGSERATGPDQSRAHHFPFRDRQDSSDVCRTGLRP